MISMDIYSIESIGLQTDLRHFHGLESGLYGAIFRPCAKREPVYWGTAWGLSHYSGVLLLGPGVKLLVRGASFTFPEDDDIFATPRVIFQ